LLAGQTDGYNRHNFAGLIGAPLSRNAGTQRAARFS
jgi:hypothetical protein